MNTDKNMDEKKNETKLLRALIIDDEAPARSELHYLLDETGLVDTIEEAASAREGVEKIIAFRPDILFLDINMPKTKGLTLAQGLSKVKHPPVVIFVTAYSEFAVNAFNLDAVDYLLKPVETERLLLALEKAQKRLQARAAKTNTNSKLPVEKSGKKVFIPMNDIRFIEAKDDYACVHTQNDHFLSSKSLTMLEELLGKGSADDNQRFFRVHRGFIANLNYVSSLDTSEDGPVHLCLDEMDDVRIPVSRRRVSPLKKMLGL